MLDQGIQYSSSRTRWLDPLTYGLSILFGIFSGWLVLALPEQGPDFTALPMVFFAMIAAVIQPRKPWRWAIVVAVFIPIARFGALLLFVNKPSTSEMYESFLAILPAIVGAYAGQFTRSTIHNIFDKGEKTEQKTDQKRD